MSKMKNKRRYQDCNLIIRLYRRIKYQPYYFIKASYYAIIQILTKRNRNKYGIFKTSFIFSLLYNEWSHKAGWYFTHEEVFGETLSETLEKMNNKENEVE